MEKIEFKYTCTDEFDMHDEGVGLSIVLTDKNHNGLRDYDIFACFEEFIDKMGYSTENLYKHFNT